MLITRMAFGGSAARMVALAVTMVLLPGVAQAKALDRMSALRLDEAKQLIAKVEIKAKLRKNVPFSRAEEVQAAYNRADSLLSQAKRALKRIPQRNQGHADVVAVRKSLRSVEAYVADLAALLKSYEGDRVVAEEKRQAMMKLSGAFRDAYGQHKDMLGVFFEPPGGDWIYVPMIQLTGAREAFREIHKGCTGKFKDLAADSDWGPWCKAAARGDEVIKLAVERNVGLRADNIRDSFIKQTENLAASKGTLMDWDERYHLDPAGRKADIEKKLAEQLALVGSTMPDTLFAEADAAHATLVAEIERHSKEWKYDPGGKKTKDSFVTKAYKKAFKGAKVRDIRLLSKKWTVHKNAFGVPQYRFKKGNVLFQLPNEKWCRTHLFSYMQDHKRKRRYGKTYFQHSPRSSRTNVVRCK